MHESARVWSRIICGSRPLVYSRAHPGDANTRNMAPAQLKKRQSTTGVDLKKDNAQHVEKGMPEVDALGWLKFVVPFLLTPVVFSAIGGAIAWYIYTHGNTTLYDRNILRLSETEQGWTYLAAAVFNLVVYWVNNYPMLYKSMVMRFSSGNLRANMQIYKQYSQQPDAGYVLLETQGPVGAYNRANRSLAHFVENSIPMALFVVLCGAVFPFPTLIATCVFGGGRVLHQVGYATIGYGAHTPGFTIAVTAQFTLQMRRSPSKRAAPWQCLGSAPVLPQGASGGSVRLEWEMPGLDPAVGKGGPLSRDPRPPPASPISASFDHLGSVSLRPTSRLAWA